ncbi:MAG: HRDC domain-containing protein [Gemmatimonadales bacterium]
MPPYVIFQDRTLAAIAAAQPAAVDELSRVKGIGPAKLAAYGEELLRLIR